MKCLKGIGITMLMLAACGVPGMIEFGDWVGPIVLGIIGGGITYFTSLYYIEE